MGMSSQRNRVLLLALSGLTCPNLGCGDDADSAESDTEREVGKPEHPYFEDTRPRPSEDLDWARCPLFTDGSEPGSLAECAMPAVRLRRDSENSEDVTVFVKRYRPVAEPRGQLWLINGGPGASSADFESYLDEFAAAGRDLELYLLDHRGTGRSTRIGCDAEEDADSADGTQIGESEWASCRDRALANFGADLSGFSTTEAAADLSELIRRTRHGEEPVFIYGVSYGTYLVQRYLQLSPQQATGVALDSICAPGACDFLLGFDRGFDTTAQALFELCAADPSCTDQLGPDPWQAVLDLFAAVDAGSCPALGLDRATTRSFLSVLLVFAELRDYLPAVVKRMTRCSSNDVASLVQLAEVLGSLGGPDPLFSDTLYAHIGLAELSATPFPTVADIETNVEALHVCPDSGPHLAPALDVWPIPPHDQYFDAFAETDIPLLMMNGDLDPQTPLAAASPLQARYQGRFQHFVVIPKSPHTTVSQSYIDDQGHTCGMDLLTQFLQDPRAELDVGCTDKVLSPVFAGDPDLTSILFGTEDPFADTPPDASSTAGSASSILRWRLPPGSPVRSPRLMRSKREP